MQNTTTTSAATGQLLRNLSRHVDAGMVAVGLAQGLDDDLAREALDALRLARDLVDDVRRALDDTEVARPVEQLRPTITEAGA